MCLVGHFSVNKRLRRMRWSVPATIPCLYTAIRVGQGAKGSYARRYTARQAKQVIMPDLGSGSSARKLDSPLDSYVVQS